MQLAVVPEKTHFLFMKSVQQRRHSVKVRRWQDTVTGIVAAGNIRAHFHSPQMCSHKVDLLQTNRSVLSPAQRRRLYVRIHKDKYINPLEECLQQNVIAVKSVGNQPSSIQQRAVKQIGYRVLPQIEISQFPFGFFIVVQFYQREPSASLQHLHRRPIESM